MGTIKNAELSEDVLNEYLSYAKSIGYDLNDIIRPQHTSKIMVMMIRSSHANAWFFVFNRLIF